MNVQIDDELYNIRDNNRDKINIFDMSFNVRNYYFKLYSYYMEMFMEFLKRKTLISKLDDDILNSDLKFKPIDEESKDFYQTIFTDFHFYYLRNNLYLYRLSKEENDILKKRIINNDYSYDDEIEKFIENTFKKVMFENLENDEISYINFGLGEGNHFAKSNSIVFGIRYDYMSNDKNSDEKSWYENYKKQIEYLSKNSNELANNLKEVLGCNIYIFEYDEYSVKKRIKKKW